MADERTGSTFTWLSSHLWNRMPVDTGAPNVVTVMVKIPANSECLFSVGGLKLTCISLQEPKPVLRPIVKFHAVPAFLQARAGQTGQKRKSPGADSDASKAESQTETEDQQE